MLIERPTDSLNSSCNVDDEPLGNRNSAQLYYSAGKPHESFVTVNLSITMNRRKIISKLDIWTVSGKNDSYTTTFQKSTELESQHAPVNQFCTIVLLKTTDNRHRQDSCLHRWNAPHQWNIRRDNPADHTRHGQNSSRHHHPRAPHRLENYTSHQSRNAPGPYPGTRRHPSPIRIEKQ